MRNFDISREPDLNSQSWYDFYEWFNCYSKFPYHSIDSNWLKEEVINQRIMNSSSVFVMHEGWSYDGKVHEYYGAI